LWLGAVAMFFVTASGLAETPTQKKLESELEKCVDIPDKLARLACFDAFAVSVIGPRDASPTHAASEPDQATVSVDVEQFGKPKPKPKPDPETTRIEGISARVKTFTRLSLSNRIRITLDNGQIWQETDGAPFRGTVRPGTEVTIVKGGLGGYRIKVPERSSPILVRRIK